MKELLSAMLIVATFLTSLGLSALLARLILQCMFHAFMGKNNHR